LSEIFTERPEKTDKARPWSTIERSDELDDVLTNLAIEADIRRNTGRSILFRAVSTFEKTAKKRDRCVDWCLIKWEDCSSFRDPNIFVVRIGWFFENP
jgi:hypothetical protein